MALKLGQDDIERISVGFHSDPAQSYSLRSEAYVDSVWQDVETEAIFKRSWQWVCHAERLREPRAYFTATIAQQPIVIIRSREGELRAFYNVCKHRAHQLIDGAGQTNKLTCPYHSWTYSLNGRLIRAPETEHWRIAKRDHALGTRY